MFEGLKFNRLTAISFFDKANSGNHRWLFMCDCKENRICSASLVKNGAIKQCKKCAKIQNTAMLKNNTIKIAKRNLLPLGLAAFNQTYNGYKNNAKQKGRELSLTKDEFKKLIALPCNYCGRSLTNTTKSRNNSGDFSYTGLDRVDSANGYHLSNCVPCCFICNRAKDDMPLSDFISWVKTINNYLNLK